MILSESEYPGIRLGSRPTPVFGRLGVWAYVSLGIYIYATSRTNRKIDCLDGADRLYG